MIFCLDNTNLIDWLQSRELPSGLIHQANCFTTMGSGIAKEIASRIPAAYEADKKTRKGDSNKLGTFSSAIISENPLKKVYNLYSQYTYGTAKRQTSYDAMVEGLKLIKKDAEEIGLKMVGIPYGMGCGLGGGDWEIVNKIIEVTFLCTEGVCVYICKL